VDSTIFITLIPLLLIITIHSILNRPFFQSDAYPQAN